jgi:hypothetical protein
MSSDRLLDRLVSDLKPVRPRRPLRELAALPVLAAVEIAVLVWLGRMRPDLHDALAMPSFWWKLLAFGALAIVAAVVAVRSFDPAGTPRPGLRLAAIIAIVALAAGWLIDAAQPGVGALIERLDWRHGVRCVGDMIVCAAPVLLALGLLMRRGAPTDPRGSALAVGVAGGAAGAFVFAFACPFDDPLYIAVWYAAGIAAVAAAARLILPAITRW